MCISQSVGAKGKNLSDDVKTVKILLNMNLGKLSTTEPIVLNNIATKQLETLIREFQSNVVKMKNPDGRIDAGGGTLKKLREGIPTDFSEALLQGIMIHAKASHVSRYAAALKEKMESYSINTNLRKAHFLAQIGHESGELIYSEEIASGAAYEGRKDLGNTQKGDGRKFKGRGLIQITGRANYTEYGKFRNIDYTADENYLLLSTDAATAVDCSCWYWVTRHLNELADKDDVLAITKRINGGTNGLADRKRILARAKFFLGL